MKADSITRFSQINMSKESKRYAKAKRILDLLHGKMFRPCDINKLVGHIYRFKQVKPKRLLQRLEAICSECQRLSKIQRKKLRFAEA
jgi:hypothetical protein